MERKRPLLGKIFIRGKIKLKTGLRIGGNTMGISIGGIDLPVIRDPITNTPYIPGSSLKGKMRSLMERLLDLKLNKNIGTDENPIWIHNCSDPNCKVCRVYGSTKSKDDENSFNIPARIIVRDAFLTESSIRMLESLETDLPYTEWKMENSLDRVTSAANPRSVERIPAGSVFNFEIIYNVENDDHKKEDLMNIFKALQLVEDDYLGGSGSRGYGKVVFSVEEVIYRPAEYYKGEKEEDELYKNLVQDEYEITEGNLEEVMNEIAEKI